MVQFIGGFFGEISVVIRQTDKHREVKGKEGGAG